MPKDPDNYEDTTGFRGQRRRFRSPSVAFRHVLLLRFVNFYGQRNTTFRVLLSQQHACAIYHK